MIPYKRNKQAYSVSTWMKPSQVTSGPRSCTDIDRLSCSTNVKGDFVHPNAYSYQKVNSEGLRGLAVYLDAATDPNNGFISSIDGPCASFIDTDGLLYPNVPWDAAYNDAVSALSTRVRGDLDLSIDAFQFKQILKTTNRIFDAVATFRKTWKSATSGKGPVKEAASIYLEWTYGIAPTLHELVQLTEKLRAKGSNGDALVHCRGRGSVKERVTKKSDVVFWSSFNFSAKAPVGFAIDSSYRCQLDVYLKPDLTSWNKLSEYASLNPVAWLYEATPYSFVGDWFWNFGQYLRSIETAALNQARFAYGTDTRSLRQVTTVVGGEVTVGRHKFTPMSGYHSFRGMDRFILSGFPVPKLPTLTPSLGWRRMINAAALLSQFLPDMFSNKPGRIRSGRTSPLLRTKPGTPRFT